MLAFLATPIGKWVGSLIGGALLLLAIAGGFRWWLHEHDKALLSGYVLQSEKTAAEAKASEMERQARANKIVADAYQVQYRNQLQKDDLADAQAEQERKAHAADNIAKGRDDGLDDSDIQFLLRKRP